MSIPTPTQEQSPPGLTLWPKTDSVESNQFWGLLWGQFKGVNDKV